MNATKIVVSSNLATIGPVSPYSYQVKPKSWADRAFVVFDGVACRSRLTSGKGKGAVVHHYAYFMVGDFQHWVQITPETAATLRNDPASVLNLFTVMAGTGPAPAVEAPAKGRKAKRETAAA